MTLRDALAAALLAAYIDPSVGRPSVEVLMENLAKRAISDPAFRAALVEAVASSVHDHLANREAVGVVVTPSWVLGPKNSTASVTSNVRECIPADHEPFARAIVDRMLP